MDENLGRLLGEVEEGLKKIFGRKLINIILFGSYARGDNDDESDIDIMALVDAKELKRYNHEIIDLEIDLTIKYGLMPSILLENKSDFEINREKEFIFETVAREGKTLYSA